MTTKHPSEDKQTESTQASNTVYETTKHPVFTQQPSSSTPSQSNNNHQPSNNTQTHPIANQQRPGKSNYRQPYINLNKPVTTNGLFIVPCNVDRGVKACGDKNHVIVTIDVPVGAVALKRAFKLRKRLHWTPILNGKLASPLLRHLAYKSKRFLTFFTLL